MPEKAAGELHQKLCGRGLSAELSRDEGLKQVAVVVNTGNKETANSEAKSIAKRRGLRYVGHLGPKPRSWHIYFEE